MNILLRGLPFIYQGQEIGMENVEFRSISEVDDISTLDEYQLALDAGLTPDAALKAVNRFSRDNARTPFQWDSSANAGFTSGTPWLNVNKELHKDQLRKPENDPIPFTSITNACLHYAKIRRIPKRLYMVI